MRLLFIYVSGFILILTNTSGPPTPFWKMAKGQQKHPPSPLTKIYSNPRNAAVVDAYVLGRKKGVGRKITKHHRNLNLLHLFTPSGLHFSTMLLLLLPLAKILNRWHSRLSLLITLPLYIGPFFLPKYYAIKRIAQYRIARGILRKKGIELDSYYIFLAVFALDFLFGTYRANPVSYSLSYTFLGILFSIKDSPKFYWPWALLGGQVLAAYCFQMPLTYVGFLGGFFLVGIFTLLFPIILLNRLLPYFNFSELPLELFLSGVELFSDISVASGFFYPEITVVALVFLLALRNIPRAALLLLLLFSSFPIYNAPGYAFRYAQRVGSVPFFETSTLKRAGKKGLVPLWKHRMKIHYH